MNQKKYQNILDPVEIVIILSQERTPNGLITFQVIEPEHFAGIEASLPAYEFYKRYEEIGKPPKPYPPVRPISTSSQEAWREYALYLEACNKALINTLDEGRGHGPNY